MEDALGGHVTTRVSAGGHSALVSGAIGRPFSTDALRASVAGAGGARITSVLDDHSGGSGSNDLSRAERLSLPVTLLVLLIAFGALVAAVVPVVLGATAVIAAFGLLGPISQVFPLGLQREDGRAPDRDGGRRRLRAVLRDPLARGASARARFARRARAHHPNVRAHGAGRRDDRRDRDGRSVHDRHRHLQRQSRPARSR